MGTKLIKEGKIAMINTQINELVAWLKMWSGIKGWIRFSETNQLLDLFRLSEFHEEEIHRKSRPLAGNSGEYGLLCSPAGDPGRRYHYMERFI